MLVNMFKSKCPECGKEVLAIKKGASMFCSKLCESNNKYRKRFVQAPKDKQRSPARVKKI